MTTARRTLASLAALALALGLLAAAVGAQPAGTLLVGLAIFVIVLALNLVGDALRDFLDPRTYS